LLVSVERHATECLFNMVAVDVLSPWDSCYSFSWPHMDSRRHHPSRRRLRLSFESGIHFWEGPRRPPADADLTPIILQLSVFRGKVRRNARTTEAGRGGAIIPNRMLNRNLLGDSAASWSTWYRGDRPHRLTGQQVVVICFVSASEREVFNEPSLLADFPVAPHALR